MRPGFWNGLEEPLKNKFHTGSNKMKLFTEYGSVCGEYSVAK
jgi:hypothetical protein